jgi:hypothetical protein
LPRINDRIDLLRLSSFCRRSVKTPGAIDSLPVSWVNTTSSETNAGCPASIGDESDVKFEDDVMILVLLPYFPSHSAIVIVPGFQGRTSNQSPFWKITTRTTHLQ